VDAEDVLMGQASSINASARTFSLSKLDLFVDEGQQKQFLITYNIPATSSSFMIFFLVIGFFLMALFKSVRKPQYIMLGMLIFFLGRCGSETQAFNPTIKDSSQIKATASGFGDTFSVQIGTPSSVKDFFQ
jgi:hypothetical protein